MPAYAIGSEDGLVVLAPRKVQDANGTVLTLGAVLDGSTPIRSGTDILGFKFYDNETPSGTIDGTTGSDGNATFTLVVAPNPSGSLRLLSGAAAAPVHRISGTHFTLSSATITFLSPYKPIVGDLIRVWYRGFPP